VATTNCITQLELGLHTALIELIEASRATMANFDADEGTYADLGGGLVENLVKALEEPLEKSVDYFDEDSAVIIEGLFNTTVTLTIVFSLILVGYYTVIIWVLLNRL
jgi:hypothetical protein